MAQNNACSNLRLLTACRRLSDEEFAATRTSFFPSLLATLNHILRLSRGQRGIDIETVGTVLPHLFVHQIHHRGQAHAMLAGTSVPPPQLDEFFCTGEAPLRAQDFAELGFSEAVIWGERAKPPAE